MSRRVLRMLTVSGAAAVAVGLSALPALAHVSVSSPGATQGGYGVLTFRVPTETDASTVGLKVQLPAEQPLSSLRVKPKAGWTATITRAKLATPITAHGEQITDYPSVVEWKAAAGNAGIEPDQFDEFQVSVGPLPEADSMTFKALQTYSDGKVVSWIEIPAAGSTEEPEHPAPTLKIAAAAVGDTQPAASASENAGVAGASADGPSQGEVTGAYVVGGAGLLAGLAGVALALRRRTTVGGSTSETGAP